ncbi:NrtA/SsuA/CpmA family ABC transporter substrate-binding protein [Amycolatopsis tucumanensis]|uniref:Sulfonate ABC transporter substrate-binding protein n=1 Tax=Amycolatopsis tucumanensis TaxID=401106 RepID=A0ABP7HHM4_9PSEU|nr:NrtA/SsuA/CpmA family ABC transporter substrate-binding protein [Amycolatopsis tucumanensis]MCF6425401.1 NrtA/SsuA/CpmA family ABC transporter substrate-binding protein [Amycolatopsis tucumanensis]
MPRSRKPLLALALVPLLALATACTGAGAGTSTDADGTFVLKVTDPGNAGPLAVGKRDGTFDKALAPLGARIEWVPSTPGFSSNLKLFNTKQLDVSGGAYSPVVGALSKDVGVRIIAVADPVGKDQNGILATPRSGIRSVRDLAGKRVAVNPAGKGEYITLQALAQAGVPVDQVERVPLQQADATSAFATGQVDAWASFNEPYQEAKANGGVEIATEQSIGSVDNTIVAFRTEVLDARPDVAAKYLETLQQLTVQQRANPADFENVFEKAGPRALSGDRLQRALALGAQAAVPRYPNEKDARDLESVANLFTQNHVIQRTITAADVFYDLPAKLAEYQKAAK